MHDDDSNWSFGKLYRERKSRLSRRQFAWHRSLMVFDFGERPLCEAKESCIWKPTWNNGYDESQGVKAPVQIKHADACPNHWQFEDKKKEKEEGARNGNTHMGTKGRLGTVGRVRVCRFAW